MKKTVNISIENEKLTALEMYLNQKNTKLSDELLKYTEQLYQKNVPSNVRDFIELAASKNQRAVGSVSRIYFYIILLHNSREVKKVKIRDS